jgi:VanZ family protein
VRKHIVTIAQRLWWGVWLLYVASWSAALLTTRPIEIRDALFEEEYHYVASKTLHVAAYAIFAVLTSLLPSRRRTMLVLVVLHGPLTEFLQLFVERTGRLTDVGFDWCGVALGVLVTWPRWRSDASQRRPAS